MSQAQVSRFSYYIVMSVLIHLVGASWVFQQSRLIALPPKRESGISVRVVTTDLGRMSAATAESVPLPVSHLVSIVRVPPPPAELGTTLAALISQITLPTPTTMAYPLLQPAPMRKIRTVAPTLKRQLPRRVTKVADAKQLGEKWKPKAELPALPLRQPSETSKREVAQPQTKMPLTTASLDQSTSGPLLHGSADTPSQAKLIHADEHVSPGKIRRKESIGGSEPRFVFQPKPKYPMIARRRGWEGTVVLNLEMLADGSIGTVEVVYSSGYHQLDKMAKTTVQRWKHEPQTPQLQRVQKWATQEIHFKLD